MHGSSELARVANASCRRGARLGEGSDNLAECVRVRPVQQRAAARDARDLEQVAPAERHE